MDGLYKRTPIFQTIWLHGIPGAMLKQSRFENHSRTLYWTMEKGPHIARTDPHVPGDQPGHFPGLSQAVIDWNNGDPLIDFGVIGLPVMAGKESAHGHGEYIGIFAWERLEGKLARVMGFYTRGDLFVSGLVDPFSLDLAAALGFVGIQNAIQ